MSDFKENTNEIINKEGGTGCLNFMRDGEREQSDIKSTVTKQMMQTLTICESG